MNTYQVVAEVDGSLITYRVDSVNVNQAYDTIEKQLTAEAKTFNIVNIDKADTGTNYSIAEAV
jgi:hypothetical protein